MANLGQKGNVYLARFRFRGIVYKKSLKTNDRRAAERALTGKDAPLLRRDTLARLAVTERVYQSAM